MNLLSSVQAQDARACNILSDEFKSNPYPTFRWWHAHEKAFWDPDQNYWVVFDYKQVRSLLTNPGLTVERYSHVPTSPEERECDSHIRKLLSVWMLNIDGTGHKIARNDIKPMFSTKALSDYDTLIRAQVDISLANLGRDERIIDIYSEIAFPLPARIVLSIMGLEGLTADELEKVRHYSDVISTYVGSAGRAPGCIKPTFEVLNDFCAFLSERVDERLPSYPKTLTARLHAIYGNGKPIAESMETLSNIILFIVSGFETTTNLILNTLLAIGHDPALQNQLRADTALIEPFVEETLRVYPPVNRTARKARNDIDLDGQTIRKGDLVILFLGAANRDPSVFPQADDMVIERPERKSNPVLSFGYGPHLCIGRMLSIMELRIFYEELLRRYSHLTVDLESVKFRDGSVLKGIEAMLMSARANDIQ